MYISLEGDLGKEATEPMLSKEFSVYKSFAKCKIIRDTSNKTKGYGFVSFLDPFDCAKALREKQGKVHGNDLSIWMNLTYIIATFLMLFR